MTDSAIPNTTTDASCSLPEGVTDPNYKPLPGRLGNLTEEQKAALEEFKQILIKKEEFVSERMDDAALLRFLRARKFNVEQAVIMIEACEEWRRKFGVDELVETFDFKEKEQVDKYYPQYYHRTDKEGRPIYIERLGLLNIGELYKITSIDRQLKRLVYEYERFLRERLPACSRAIGHPVETSCTILDLSKVSLSNFIRVRDYISAAASVGQDRYPETMGKFYIINAPWGFSTIYSVIKPWLDPVTVSKIDVLGSNYKDQLLAQIPVENLPKEFGGTCECPGGCSLSDAGPWNPSKA